MKILIVEDEPDLAKSLTESLHKEQYVVECAGNFSAASEKLALYEYDCILLDISLPGGSGFDLLSDLKDMGKSGKVIIISAKDSLDDKLRGLDLGADDYLTKPFYIAELNARIKAVLRRNNPGAKDEVSFGNVVLDISERTLTVATKPVKLFRKEFDILNYFLFNTNRLISKTALAERVWGDQIDQADNLDFIYYQIKNLRKKLNDAGATVEIASQYGVGYKLVEK